MPTESKFISNVVYNQPFDPRDDITVSFLYSSPSIDTGDNLLLEGGEFDEALFELETSGDFLVLNFGEVSFNGLGVFLIDGSINTLTGGGAGSTDVTLSTYDPGIGMVTDTTSTASSAISGFIAAIALDQSGAFGKQSSLDQFTTGTSELSSGNIVVRTFNSETSTFPFKGSETPSAPTVVEESFNIFRVGFKRRLQDIVFYKKEGNIYEPDVSFTTDIALSAIPESVKIGFTYSGTKPTDLKNIAVNGARFGDIQPVESGGGGDFRIPAPEPTYNLSRNTSNVNEGQSFTVTLITTNINDGNTVPYTITGIQSGISENLTGNFTISNNTATATFNVTADSLTEGPETFILTLDNDEDDIHITINDTSRTPSYSLSIDGDSIINETDNNLGTIRLTTQNVNDGETISYTISGTGITVDDFVGLTNLRGEFIVGTTDTVTLIVREDFITEGNETLLLSLDNNNDSINITINDTSTPTYDLSSNKLTVDEGDNFTITLTTQGVDDGVSVPYTISGVDDTDINESSTGGSFTVNNNIAEATFNVVEDVFTDGEKIFTLRINASTVISITINDTSNTPGFELTSNSNVNETLPGNAVEITLVTENVLAGTELDYTISGTGITVDDFVGLTDLTGSFTVDSNNTVTLTVREDFTTEGTETFTLSLDNNKASKTIGINDTSVETYDVSTNKSNVNEGDSFTITLETRGVVNNTLVPYNINGVSSNDIGGVNTSGSFTVIDGTAEVTFNITEDLSSIEPEFKENLETFILTLTNTGETVSVEINDTSVQTYELESSSASVNEGGNFTITLTTQGVDDGVSVPYTISGVVPADIDGVSLTGGSFTVNNNTATATFNVTADSLTEGIETFTLALDNNAASESVEINDTSIEQTYTIQSTATNVIEGGNFTVTLITTNIDDGNTVPYTISGVVPADIDEVSLTGGSFTVNNNTATATFNVTADASAEDNVTFTLALDNGEASISVGIIDTSNATFELEKRGGAGHYFTSANEGAEIIRIYLNTTGLPVGTAVPYTITGVDIDDFTTFSSSNFPQGNFITGQNVSTDENYISYGVWQQNSSLFTFTIREDLKLEGQETFTITLDNGLSTVSFPINDTSVPTYNLTSNITGTYLGRGVANEGDNFIVTLTTTGVAQGTSVGYSVGGIDAADIVESTTGNFTIGADGTATTTFNVVADGVTEGQQVFTLLLDNDQDYIEVYIVDTSRAIDWSQLGLDIDGEAAGDQSGYSVSMNSTGDRVAIGAVGNDAGGAESGHTRIYEYDGTNWSQLGSDIDGEAAGGTSGYRVSINSAGDRVAIGGIFNDDGGSNSGHTRIYEYDGTNWVQLGLDIDGEAAGDYSGYSVSMNSTGDRVAIGAIGNDAGGAESGHTRIYEYDGTNWVQLGLDIDGEAAGEYSGYSVSMNSTGDRVAIGATGNGAVGAQPGHTRIYEYNGTNWVQLGLDIDGEANADQSGNSVSMNSTGDRVAIGARLNDDGGAASGHTRIYEYDGTNWSQLGSDIDGEAADDRSGYSVSMNSTGDRVAIGARLNDSGANINSGHTRIYEYNGTNWVQLGLDIDGEAIGDRSGFSVSMNSTGDRVAIGAGYNDDGGTVSGHTRIYNIA